MLCAGLSPSFLWLEGELVHTAEHPIIWGRPNYRRPVSQKKRVCYSSFNGDLDLGCSFGEGKILTIH